MKICILCSTSPAETAEHIYKKSQIKSLFTENIDPQLFMISGSVKMSSAEKIQGPNSKKIKFHKSLCAKCNNDVSQKHDKAYDKISLQSQNSALEKMSDLVDAFGTNLGILPIIDNSNDALLYLAGVKLDLINIYTVLSYGKNLLLLENNTPFKRDVARLSTYIPMPKFSIPNTIPLKKHISNYSSVRTEQKNELAPYFAKIVCCFLDEWNYPIPSTLTNVFNNGLSKNIHFNVMVLRPWVKTVPIMFLSHCFVDIAGKLTYLFYQENKEKNISYFAYFSLNSVEPAVALEMKKHLNVFGSGNTDLLT